MKKNYFLTMLSLLFCIALQAQVTYSGNGNSGFGGALGSNSLSLSDNGTTITFDFNSAIGSNVIVIYIDSKAGGFANAESFTDNTDGGRRAVSTVDGANNPVVTFPAGFTADYAVAIGSSFAALFELSTGLHTATGLTYTSGDTSVTFAQLGMTATDKFDFVAILNSDTTFLSDEVIGTSTVSGNPGFGGSLTFSDSRSYPNTWTGTTNTDWATATNWTEGVPSATHNVYIPAVTNHPTASGVVTINKGVIKSGATLIAQDAFNGTITYERNLPTVDSWYLVSSPVAGETFEDLITNFNFATGNTPPNIGISSYNQTLPVWSYASLATTGSLVAGEGYSVRLASPGNIGFTGTINTSDISFALSQGTNNYNLLGNPFTSFINSDTFLTNENTNVELTFWMWNGTSYDTRTTGTSPNFKIAPGQGFFVEAKTSNNVTFTEALQSHETVDNFQKSTNDRPEIKLTLTEGTQSRKIEVFYIDGTTKGFDNGFDGKMFGGTTDNFSIFSELLSESVGVKYALQSLPNSDFENMVIPVGVKADAGKEITFTAEAMNLPADVKVFLEDRLLNTVTRLDETNATYKVTLTEDANGTGRFYLHTKASSVLSTDQIALENTSIYATNNNTLRVVGLPSGTANVKVFTILGKQVMQSSFSSTGVHEISLPKLATGMYIVQLETATGKLNKKIVLE
jgi:hypothetical protein